MGQWQKHLPATPATGPPSQKLPFSVSSSNSFSVFLNACFDISISWRNLWAYVPTNPRHPSPQGKLPSTMFFQPRVLHLPIKGCLQFLLLRNSELGHYDDFGQWPEKGWGGFRAELELLIVHSQFPVTPRWQDRLCLHSGVLYWPTCFYKVDQLLFLLWRALVYFPTIHFRDLSGTSAIA